MTETLARFRTLLAQSARQLELRKDLKTAAALRQAQGKLRDLLNRRENPQPPKVAFVGLTNAGKSTLLSALFGAKVAPTSNRPWSSVPVEYRYGDEFAVLAEFADTVDSSAEKFDSSDGMLDFIARNATAGGMADSRFLSAEMPAPILKDGLVIADTPGFGAAEAAGGMQHGDRLADYLPEADHVFWVIKSLQGVTRVEKDFYDEFLAERCRDIVVNCFDDFGEDERNEFVRINEKALGVRFVWHFVDAKSALRGRMRGDEGLVSLSGLTALEDVLRALVPTVAQRMRAEAELVRLFEDIARYRRRGRNPLLFAEVDRLVTLAAFRREDDGSELANAIWHSISTAQEERYRT